MRGTILLCLTLLAPAAAADRFPAPPAPADLTVAPATATPTPSGLATLQLRPGTGQLHPGPDDLVTVEYTLWTRDGKVLDSTGRLDGPFTRPMVRLLKGMREGLQLMTAGEKRRIWVPEALAFGGAANRPAGPMVLELELLGFEPSPFKAPTDLLTPGEGARLLDSGLMTKVLRVGQGKAHPTWNSHVTVHYSGWTADGKLFDSTWRTAQPASFRLDQVITGWTEGVQRMVIGEKTRFWVPEKMAYRGESGQPAGLLVFDIELLDIEK